MKNLLNLRPLQDTDVEQMKIWLYKDHILKWYHDTDDWLKEIKEISREFRFFPEHSTLLKIRCSLK